MKSGNVISRAKIKKILDILNERYPEPKTELNFSTPFELLVATMLSAQTTDRQVNKITANLFAKWRTPEEFAVLPTATLEEEIKSCGLFKNKAKNIIAASKILVNQYNSEVPRDFADLLNIPGVGRKTANVVLANAFGKDVIAVDTHVFRVSNRLGLADSGSVDDTEGQLMANIPAGLRNNAHHWLILHGRHTCKAQNPKCPECPINSYCRFVKQ
jgi:endonuclease-3